MSAALTVGEWLLLIPRDDNRTHAVGLQLKLIACNHACKQVFVCVCVLLSQLTQ